MNWGFRYGIVMCIDVQLCISVLKRSGVVFVYVKMVQVRHVSSRERKKRRKPMTPVTSKLKKTKLKSYS